MMPFFIRKKRFILTPKQCVVVAIFAPISLSVNAGAYVFSGEANGVKLVTHPPSYTGVGGELTVRVCIAPGSDNALAMEYPVQNNIAVYNQLLPTTNNLKRNTNNNIPSGFLDFESVALHEIGHCLGMAHINAATESGLTGGQQNYTKATKGVNGNFDLDNGLDGEVGSSDDIRGDDVNLVFFRKSNNDPFTIDTTVIDSTTYSNDIIDLPVGHSFAANADRSVASLSGLSNTEAVMQQGTFFDEAQRTLGHDDVATLKYAQSGINERESGGANANDNYTIKMVYGGISATNCDISLSFTNTTGLAFCSVSGVFIGGGGAAPHLAVTNASIEFGKNFSWYFNAVNVAPQIVTFTEPALLEGAVQVLTLSATDQNVTDTLSLSISGLPAFASFVDNGDGSATLTMSPAVGEATSYNLTVTATDSGVPSLQTSLPFSLTVIADTDGDGLSDNDELTIYLTSPTNADSDGDNLNDGDEVITYGTNPNAVDTDGDFVNDDIEVSLGSNPLDNASLPVIADGDLAPLGAPDGVLNAADLLIAQRIVLGSVVPSLLDLAHGDVYPVGNPDGLINVSDLILIRQLVGVGP